VPDLRIEPVDGDAAAALLTDWRYVHNLIVPAPSSVLTPDDVRERARRHHLEVAYLGDVLVGCTTVRSPTGSPSVATVIARVLPAHRRRGFGGELYARGLAQALKLGADLIETVVLESNQDGLRFALAHGFVESDRYLLPGDSVPFIDLRLNSVV
jgi:GNAT superfamily N-acetyltransferase